jgi:hypothetical protein
VEKEKIASALIHAPNSAYPFNPTRPPSTSIYAELNVTHDR